MIFKILKSIIFAGDKSGILFSNSGNERFPKWPEGFGQWVEFGHQNNRRILWRIR